MKKYLRVLTNFFQASFEYRIDIVMSIVMETVSIAAALILWLSIFKNSNSLGSYTMSETVSYFVLLPVVGFLTQVTTSDGLGEQIKNGDFSNYLTKPMGIWKTEFIKALAGKMNYLLFSLPVYLLFILFVSKTVKVELVFGNFILAAVFIGLGFILNFIIDMTIATMAFWVDEVWSFKHLRRISGLFLGGLAFPLGIASGSLRRLIDLMPFKYIYYVPTSFLSGKFGYGELVVNLISVFIWIIVLAGIGLFLFNLGIRKYGAYGN